MLLQAEQVRRQMIDGDGYGMWFGGGMGDDVALAEAPSPLLMAARLGVNCSTE